MNEMTLSRMTSVKASSIISTITMGNMSQRMGSDNNSLHREELDVKHEGVPVVFGLTIDPNDDENVYVNISPLQVYIYSSQPAKKVHKPVS